jgi:hypothetical protein
MWMLSFIPDSFLHLVILGVIGIGVLTYLVIPLLHFFPNLLPLKEPARILATVLIIAGVYFYGSYDTEMSWRKKVEEQQAQIDKAEAASKDANAKLDAVRKQKQKVRVEYYAQVHERVREVEKQINAECKLDPVVPKLINEAAKNPYTAGSVTVEVNK